MSGSNGILSVPGDFSGQQLVTYDKGEIIGVRCLRSDEYALSARAFFDMLIKTCGNNCEEVIKLIYNSARV